MYDAASGYGGSGSSYAPQYGGFLGSAVGKLGLGGGGYGGGVPPVSTELTQDEQLAREGFRSMSDMPGYFSQNIGAYMNPSTGEVIDSTIADLNRARQMANVDAAGYATRAGAFGGDRAAILEAENNRNYLESAARSAAQLRSAGFDQASRNLYQGLGLQTGAYGNLASLGAMERQIPMQYYDFLSGLLSRVPGNTTETMTENGSLLGGLAGLAGTLGGAYIGRKR